MAHHPQVALLLASVHDHILSDIDQQQLVLPCPAALPLKRSSTSPNHEANNSSVEQRKKLRAKSEFSLQDRLKVQQLKEEMANFERSLTQKEELLFASQREETEQQQMHREKQLELARSQRRKEVARRRQARWQQKRREEQQRKQGSPVSPRSRPLYQQLQQLSQQQRQLQHQQIQEALALISQQKRAVDVHSLSHHQQHYAQHLQLTRAERAQRLQHIRQTSMQIEQKEDRDRPKSKFYLRVQQQEAHMQLQAQQQEHSKRQKQERIQLFMQQLRSSPHLQPHRPTPPPPQPHRPSPLPNQLSSQQLRDQGNRFMRESVLRTSRTAPTRTLSEPAQPLPALPPPPDYLRQLRSLRQKGEQQHSGSLVQLTQIKIGKIMGSALGQEEKVERLKKLASKLEIGVGMGGNVEIQRLEARLSILDATLRSSE